jgi:23S rRNA (adenine2503-C2)-methyltransferase
VCKSRLCIVGELQGILLVGKISLSGKSLKQLEELVISNGWPPYRAKQIHSWLYAKKISSIDEMTDLPVEAREELKQTAEIPVLTLSHLQASKDGTRKYLFSLSDGNTVESVLMRFEDRSTLSACVSTQVGCAVGCTFCATGYLGFKRNLDAAEIVDQIMCMQRESGCRIDNVVYMGQGEPLLNVEEVIKSIYILRDSVGIGMRHLTVSTSGIIPGIERLAQEDLPITLALSLHAPTQDLRSSIVPIGEKYQLKELIAALRNYAETTGRRVTIEYVLLAGLTDLPELARQLADLLKDLHCNVNLIPYNEAGHNNGGPSYRRPPLKTQLQFKRIAESSGKTVTIRLERGTDIDAACGQLHNSYSSSSSSSSL